jgi:hypothetical protein
MAITKTKLLGDIHVDSTWWLVFYEEFLRIDEDGEEIALKSRRITIEPGDPLQGHPQDVKDICQLLHTQARIDAWADIKSARL